MWSWVLEVLSDAVVGSALAFPGRSRRPRRTREVLPPVPRPTWWKWSAAVSVMVAPLPLVVGALYVFVLGMRVADDDFLMFIGLIFFMVALFLAWMTLLFLVTAVQTALRVAADRPEARWFVLGIGALTLLVGVMGLSIPLPRLGPIVCVLSGVACCVLGVYAPVDESAPGRRTARIR